MRKYFLVGLLLLSSLAQAEQVTLKISNMGGEKGQLAVAVFNDPDAFPDRAKDAVLSSFFPLAGGVNESSVTIELKPGRYALASFLDQNKNQKLDTNIVGAPKERFGFSQNPRIMFSAPNFAECAFEVEANKKQVISLRLNKLF